MQQTPNIFSNVCMPVTALISGWERNYYIFSMCRYAQSCAFISVIELPRILAYYPKKPRVFDVTVNSKGEILRYDIQNIKGNLFIEDVEVHQQIMAALAEK